MKSSKIISFSLWGKDPKYTVGAIRNADLASKIYPGWTPRFYVGSCVPLEILEELRHRNAQVVEMNTPGDWTSTFWRFESASDKDVEVMISRDTDSRLNYREAAAVKEWLDSKYEFHIMRDHPAHDTEILAGMWGVKFPFLSNMKDLIKNYTKENLKQSDQNFLRDVVYRKVYQNSMVHDPFFEKKPFPTIRTNFEFVGDVFDIEDNRHSFFWKDIQKLGIL